MEIKIRNNGYAEVLAWLKIYKYNDIDSTKSIMLIKNESGSYQIALNVHITYVGETENIIDSNVYTFESIDSFLTLQQAMIQLATIIRKRKLDRSITYFKTFDNEADTPEMQAIYKDIVNRSLKVELIDDDVHDIKRMKVINELKAFEEEDNNVIKDIGQIQEKKGS